MRIAILRLILLLALLGRLNAADSTADLSGSIGVEVVDIAAGANVVFSASAESTTPVAFEWRKNGGAVAGGSGATLRFTGITAVDAGVYTAIASNAYGAVVSNAVVIVVNGVGASPSLPIITSQPIDAQISLQGDASFQVGTAAGTASTYQWLKNGAPISDATSATLSLTNVLSSDSYSVVVSNDAGAVVSNVARALFPAQSVSNATLPIITREPGDLQVAWSSNVMLNVMATGSPAPTFQWQKDGVPIAGATRSFLSLNGVTASASYSVLVTNAAGSVSSRSASLVVTGAPTAPAFTSQPVSQAVTVGTGVTFSVAVAGSPAPSLQWRKNGLDVSGATSSTLRLDPVTKNDEGNYDVLARNVASSVLSNAASLVVQVPYVAPPPPPMPSGPIAGVVQRANFTFTLDAGTKRTVAFMIRDKPKTILVRAVGPTLATLGVGGAMADPQIEMLSGLTLTNRNDNWGGGANLMKAFVEAGATPFMDANSKDAAFFMTVAPGTYTAVVSAADGGGGTVLVEVYEFP